MEYANNKAKTKLSISVLDLLHTLVYYSNTFKYTTFFQNTNGIIINIPILTN